MLFKSSTLKHAMSIIINICSSMALVLLAFNNSSANVLKRNRNFKFPITATSQQLNISDTSNMVTGYPFLKTVQSENFSDAHEIYPWKEDPSCKHFAIKVTTVNEENIALYCFSIILYYSLINFS